MADQILNSNLTLVTFLAAIALFIATVILIAYRRHRLQCQELTMASESAFALKCAELDIQELENLDYPENSWRGFQSFKVIEKKVETWTKFRGEKVSDICSFKLAPMSTPTPLPTFYPGQHLSFQLPLNDGLNVRYYSLSDAPNAEYYRVSIKRALPPRSADSNVSPGLGSSYFHDHIQENDLVLTGQPAGDFYLDTREKDDGPVVLLAGGIGITPMVSMAKTLGHLGFEDKVYLFYGVRTAQEIALIDDLKYIADIVQDVEIFICLSGTTTEEDFPEVCKHKHIHAVTGTKKDGTPILNEPGKGSRLTVDLLKVIVERSSLADFYLCGPPPMMKSLVDGIYYWGIKRPQVHWEGFGPCAVNWPEDILNSPLKPCTITVVDKQQDDAKYHLDWSPSKGSILNIADQHSDKVRTIRRQCGQGACGQCKTNCKGTVVYNKKPAYSGLKSNECLTCCARPNGDVLIYLQ